MKMKKSGRQYEYRKEVAMEIRSKYLYLEPQ